MNLSQIPWVRALQTLGLEDLARLGFPTRHHEHWKHTSTDAFLKKQFKPSVQAMHQGPPIPVGQTISWVDDYPLSLPEGVLAMPLNRALDEHPEKIKPYLNQILRHEHGFHAQNTAMLNCGLFIYVPKDVCLTTPLCLSHWQDGMHQAMCLRHLVVLEAGSALSLIEDYQGDAQTCYYRNTITEVSLAEHANLTHHKIQRESPLAFHVGELVAQLAEGSQLNSHSFSLGGGWVRSDTSIDLQAPDAHCLMNGVYLATKHSHVDHHTVVTHNAPNCQSVQDYKGILRDESRAVFNGRVMVMPGAHHTKATQQNKNILLSKGSEIDTKPQLDIFADDVVCTHGATVGQLDEDALFYFATRGIERTEATGYLLKAFTMDNVRYLDNDEMALWVGQLIT